MYAFLIVPLNDICVKSLSHHPDIARWRDEGSYLLRDTEDLSLTLGMTVQKMPALIIRRAFFRAVENQIALSTHLNRSDLGIEPTVCATT